MTGDDRTEQRPQCDQAGAGPPQVPEAGVPLEWQVGDTILDLYEVKDVFTSGGMGLVYRVHHRGWGLDLAVKCPRQEYFRSDAQRQDFAREAETWVSLGLHPHIVACHYVRNLGGIPRVFAEFVEGGSLKGWVRDRRLYAGGPQRALERILDVAIQSAWGLAYAHERGLVHQDVKPANVLMAPSGTAKVNDFGLARARAAVGEPSGAAGAGILVSAGGMTPAYCSPEQARGARLTPQTDIWSWAVSVLEMFTGEVTWLSGAAAPAVLEMYLEEPAGPEGTPRLPAAVAELLQHCFQEDPSDRPPSMGAVAERLRQAYAELRGQPHARPAPRPMGLPADTLNNRALSLLDLGRADEAEKTWRAVFLTDPHHAEATYNHTLYGWYRRRGPYGPALVQRLADQAAQHPDEWQRWYLLGRACQTLRHAGRAREALQKAREMAPQEPAVSLALSQIGESQPGWPRLARSYRGLLPSLRLFVVIPDRGWLVSADGARCDVYHLESDDRLGEFRPHNGAVAWMAALPGDVECISLGYDGSLCRWDPATRRPRVVGQAGARLVNCGALSPDGQRVLVGDRAGSLHLWDFAKLTCRKLDGPPGSVTSVSFVPDSPLAVAGGDDGTVRLWDLESGQIIRSMQPAPRRILQVQVAGDGQRVLGTAWDQPLLVWDLKTGGLVDSFGDAGYGEILCAGGSVLGLSGRYASLFDLRSGLESAFLEFPVWRAEGPEIREAGGALSMMPVDSHHLYIGGAGVLHLVDLGTLDPPPATPPYQLSQVRETETLAGYEERYRLLTRWARALLGAGEWDEARDAIGQALSVSGFERHADALDLWNELGGRGIRRALRGARPEYRCDTSGLGCLAISPDGKWAVSGDREGRVSLCDWPDGAHRQDLGPASGPFHGLSISGDGTTIAAQGQDGAVVWRKQGAGWELAHAEPEGRIHLSWDGNLGLVVRGAQQDFILLRDIRSHDVLSGPSHQRGLRSAQITGDGCRALLQYKASVELVELGSMELLDFYPMEDVEAAAISPDGKRVAIANDAGIVVVRDWETGEALWELEGDPMHPVSALQFTPDGAFLWRASWAEATLWDLRAGTVVHSLEAERGDIAVTQNGRYLVATGDSVRVWQLDWDYEFPQLADWDEGARPYLGMFLFLQRPSADGRASAEAQPAWTELAFLRLLADLRHRGYGWLRPQGVRRQLEEMAAQRGG